MAAARKIPRLDSSDPIGYALGKIIRFRMKEIASCREDFLTTASAGAVHDLRVALRRLQSVLKSFDGILPRKKIAPFRKIAKKDIRLLGEIRECDIIIAELNGFQERIPSGDQTALWLLEARHARHRRRLLPELKREIRTSLDKKFLQEFPEAIVQYGDKRKSASDVTLRVGFGELLVNHLHELLRQGKQAIDNPDDAKFLHSLRINAKPFRYLYEIASTVITELEIRYETVKRLLELLGVIHDIDTIIPVVRDHIDELRTVNRRLAESDRRIRIEGEERVLAALRDRRNKAFIECRTVLDQWDRENEPGQLANILLPKNN